MEATNHFIFRKPSNPFLATIVDDYFYIDAHISELALGPEFILPYPRITFGYFFNHPFTVINETLNESALVNVAISRISTNKIIVQPTTDRIRICGSHIKPFGLAYFTERPIHTLPWIIHTTELFGSIAHNFTNRLDHAPDVETIFAETEKVFLDNLLDPDLTLIRKAVDLIEDPDGPTEVSHLSEQLGTTVRTLRNHFYRSVGCSPKEYIKIVKLKRVFNQLAHDKHSLTRIAYDNQYFDQAHFIKELKGITGYTPSQLRKELPYFRFLQF